MESIALIASEAENQLRSQPIIDRIRRYVSEHLNLWAIVVLSLSFFILMVGRWVLGNPTFLPWIMFFPILVGVLYLPKSRINRLPMGLAFLAVCLCGAALLDLSGVLRGRILPEPVYVTRLSDDPTGGASRRLMRELSQGGVSVGIVQRKFRNVREVLDWIAIRPPTRMVLLAGAGWANLVVSVEAPSVVHDLPDWWEREAHALRIDPVRDGIILPSELGADPLWLITSVHSIQVPLTPPQSVGQYLQAMSLGLQALKSGEDPIEHFRQALLLDIAWKSSTPMAYAAFLAGTTQLARWRDRAEVTCARLLLDYAATTIKASKNRDLSQAVLHNRLIAAIRSEQDPGRILQYARSLGVLSRARKPDGSVPLVARAALLNLRTLDRLLYSKVITSRKRDR